MNLLLFFTVFFLAGFTLFTLYKQLKFKTVKLNHHTMQAKRILNLSDLKDNRNWFISRFNKEEGHLADVQASCVKNFKYKSIVNIREKLNDIQKDSSLNN